MFYYFPKILVLFLIFLHIVLKCSFIYTIKVLLDRNVVEEKCLQTHFLYILDLIVRLMRVYLVLILVPYTCGEKKSFCLFHTLDLFLRFMKVNLGHLTDSL